MDFHRSLIHPSPQMETNPDVINTRRQTAVCLHNVLLLGDERELTAGTRNSKEISRPLMRKVLDGLMYKKFQNSRPLEVESRPVELGWGQVEDVDPPGLRCRGSFGMTEIFI